MSEKKTTVKQKLEEKSYFSDKESHNDSSSSSDEESNNDSSSSSDEESNNDSSSSSNEESDNDLSSSSNEELDRIILNKIYNIDCISYIKKIKDRCIDTIILDPPYFKVVNEKWDKKWKSLNDYLEWIEKIIKELEKVAKYSCSLWIFGYAYQLGFIIPLLEKNGFTYRQHITINKGMRSVAGRTSNKLKMFPTATEYVIYFHKESRHIIKKYLQNKQKEKKIKSSDINKFLGKAINGGGTWSTIAGKKQKNIQYPTREDWNKLEKLFGSFDIKYDDYVYKFNVIPGLIDVWDDINFYDKTYKKCHPTQKPYKLIERLILCSSEKGDTILDPFMGSGMTALVCKDNNRNYYGCEIEKKYLNKALIK
jgi:DNA modification methylase